MKMYDLGPKNLITDIVKKRNKNLNYPKDEILSIQSNYKIVMRYTKTK